MPATVNSPATVRSSSVVQLRARLASATQPQARPDMAQLMTALRVEEARHEAATAAILAEIATALGEAGVPLRAVTGERHDSKKRAAAELRLTESRLMRIIGRYHAQYPDHPRIAAQPGGSKHSPWIVYTDRVRAIIEGVMPH